MYRSVRGRVQDLSAYYRKLDKQVLSEYERKIQEQFKTLESLALTDCMKIV